MKRHSFTFVLVAALGATASLTSPASAQPRPGQPPAQLAPPTPGKPGNPPAIMSLLGTIAIVGGIVGTALIPAKRGHQD